MPKTSWFAEYACGCITPEVPLKRDLDRYCPKHGGERRVVGKTTRDVSVLTSTGGPDDGQ